MNGRAGGPKDAPAEPDAYRFLFDLNPQPMFLIELGALRFLDVNEAAVRDYGWTREEFLAMTLPELWPKDDRPRYLELLEQMPPELQEVGLRRHVKKDGSVITARITRRTLDFKGRAASLAVAADVSDHHSAIQALKEKEDFFRLMVEGIRDHGVILLDSGGRVLTWNQGAQRTTGYSAPEVVGRHWSCFHVPEDVRQGKPDASLILAESKGRCEEDGWRLRKDGSRFYCECSLSALRDGEGRLTGFVAIARDVTERKDLERKVLQAAEHEQKRLGRDLHDSLGQRLTGLSLMAKTLEERLSGPRATELAVIRKKLAETLEETRRLSRGLYSADIEANHLPEALAQLLADTKVASGVKAELRCDGHGAPDKVVAAQLYHIAQEAVHNAIRHGRAKRLWVVLERRQESLVLTVRDDGVGITDKPSSGLGLRIMSYRAELIGGDCSVSRRPEGGTIVSCRISAEKMA